MSISFTQLFDLTEFEFIAGDTQTLEFYTYTAGSAGLNVVSATKTLKIAALGDSTALLSLPCSMSGSEINHVIVTISGSDTASLPEGEYYHQLQITDTSGSLHIPSQGLIHIAQKIT